MSRAWRLVPFDPANAEQWALWRDVARRAGACPALLPEFVFVCAETLGRRPLTLAVCGPVEAPCAVALIDRRRPLLPEVFIVSQMPLGAWIAMPGESIEQLAAALIRSCGPALQLGFAQVDSRYSPRPRSTTMLGTIDYVETAWVQVEGSFDGYWAARGRNLRTNMRRQRDRLAADGVRARLEVLTAPQQMETAVRDYASLESRGWKAAGGTAVSDDHPQTVFYVRMLERFASLGMARVYRYLFDDRVVASELCLHDGSELLILKTTYDESVAPLSPASLMRQEVFRSLFGDGQTRRVEFYGPLKEWHTRWTPLHREIYHANAYRWPLLGRLRSMMRGNAASAPAPASPEGATPGAEAATREVSHG